MPREQASDTTPLPITVLTGFLGSGKTTLLRRAIAAPALSDTAVIVNEIGAIAIDHHLVDLVEGSVLELPGGCLCCAVREDLARSLRGLIERRDTGELRPFRRVVIETSGLADPAPILYTLGADPLLDARTRPARVVTVVDAAQGVATLARFAEAERQAALADALFISKTDLAPFGTALAQRLAALNPEAERHLGGAADDPGALLFGGPATAARRTDTTAPQVAVHSHGIDSFALVLGRPIDRLAFARALGGLAGARGPDLLRVKGIVEFADRPGRPALVQGAQHALFEPEWLPDWPDADRRSRLVFVVHEIARGEVLERFAGAAPVIVSG